MLRTTPSRIILVAAFGLTGCGESAYPSGAQVRVPGPDAPRTDFCSDTRTGSYDDDVVVPEGATCTLRGAIVSANVKALEGARLYIFDSLITGSVEGNGAVIVQVVGGTVEGDIRILDGTSPGEIGAVVDATTLTLGDVWIERMRTARIQVTAADLRRGGIRVADNVVDNRLDVVGNGVAGSLQVFRNGGAGEKLVRDNRALDLQCEQNAPPFTGGPNRTDDAEAQCF